VQQQPDSQERALQLLISTNTIKIQLPYTTEITEKDKVVFNNVIYDVIYVPAKHSLMGAFVIQLEKKK
jgi:SPP1 family predicted phage head-tail adaptor